MSAETIETIIEEWRSDEERSLNVVHVERVPERVARYSEPTKAVPAGLAQRLEEQGIAALYHHQALAMDSIMEGRHTVVVAGTASGKSLAYQAPIAAAIEQTPSATALALYPTKALAQDQLSAFARVGGDQLVAAVYDGDTPTDERRWVRRNAPIEHEYLTFRHQLA